MQDPLFCGLDSTVRVGTTASEVRIANSSDGASVSTSLTPLPVGLDTRHEGHRHGRRLLKPLLGTWQRCSLGNLKVSEEPSDQLVLTVIVDGESSLCIRALVEGQRCDRPMLQVMVTAMFDETVHLLNG